MKTLLWKELRETARWVPLGLIVASAIVRYSLPEKSTMFTPVASNLVLGYTIAAGAFAAILGIMQSAFDLRAGNRAYLWHRGVTIWQIVSAKWIAALIWQLVAFGTPLVVAAVWLHFHGLQQFPVRPAQVIPALVMALASLALHLAMLVTLARPAAWCGTRLLPLVGPVILQLLLANQLAHGGMLGAAIGLAMACVVLSGMLLSATQSWTTLACEPPQQQANHPRWPLRALLIGSALGAVPVATIAFWLTYEALCDTDVARSRRQMSWEYVLDFATSDPWILQRSIESDPTTARPSVTAGYHLLPAGTEYYSQALESTDTREFQLLAAPNSRHTRYFLPSDGFFTQAEVFRFQQKPERCAYVFDHRGYLLAYDARASGLMSAICVDGTYASVGPWGCPFVTNPIIEGWGVRTHQSVSGDSDKVAVSTSRFLMDDRGIYLLRDTRLDSLVSTSVEHAALVVRGKKKESLHLLVLSEGDFSDYELSDSEGDSELFARNGWDSSTCIHARLVARVPVNSLGLTSMQGLSVAVGANETVLWRREGPHDRFVRMPVEGTPRITSVPVPKEVALREPILFPATFPPGLLSLALFVRSPYSFAERMQFAYWTPTAFWVLAGTCEAIAIGITVYLARQRCLSWSSTIGWALATVPLGLAGPLAVIALYRCPLTERCHACGKARRIDTLRCEHCQSGWQKSVREGVEMMDGPNAMALNAV